MFAACLRTIEKADRACYQRYLFSFDRGSAYYDDVARTFSCSNYTTVKRIHKTPGHTFNIVEALRSVVDQTQPNDLVFVIAEDVLVTTDVFHFHETAHKLEPNAFYVSSTIGSRMIYSNHSEELIYRSTFKDLHCVSFRAWRLEDLLRAVGKAYYRDPIRYCSNILTSSLPTLDVAIEGIIRRIMEPISGYGMHPVVPRAYHVGFAGMNHGGERAIERAFDPRNWEEDADQILMMNTEQLNALAESPYRDLARGELIRSKAILRVV